MKGFIFGALGDIAVSAGSMYLLEGIASLNPAEIGAGGALIALGGWLKSQGKSSGASPSVNTSAGSYSGSAEASKGPEKSSAADAGPAIEAGSPQHNIQMVVHGNLYSSNEAKLEMMDLMRQATDATGYQYVQVGAN